MFLWLERHPSHYNLNASILVLLLFKLSLTFVYIFKYLIKNVPWYGPIYQEAYRFEEKCEEYERAINIVEKGLKENPRYGPLWFSALRITNY